MSNTKTSMNLRCLCEAAILVALAQVLSYIKLMELPNGGSLTPAMFPLLLFAVRWGVKPGLLAGFAFGLLQLIFDGAYAWGWQSMLLDYLVAFTPLGLAGLFRGRLKSHPAAFTLGCLVAGLLRYLCSFLSGWILWSEYADAAFSPLLAGMSGQQLACFYSLVYNGGYMIPEILITCLAGFLVMKFAGKQILKGTEDSLGRG